MPRNVRNFWIEARIEGRATALEGGPQSRDGGIGVTLYIREGGSVAEALTITGRPSRDGSTITLDVTVPHEMRGRVTRGASAGFTITTER